MRVTVEAGEGSHPVVTTQAAEKIYRSQGFDTRIETRLAVAGGAAVAAAVSEHLEDHHGDYAAVAATQDWHIDPGEHFSSEPDFIDTWPVHGVADSAEAQIHPALSALEADAAARPERRGPLAGVMRVRPSRGAAPRRSRRPAPARAAARGGG